MTVSAPCLRPAVAALLCATALALPAPASAWSPDGHRIVARLAWERLGPAARRAVDDLLAGGHGPPAEAAVWADRVRGEPGLEHTAPWHYANVPDGAERLVLERDCPPAGCVVRALSEQAARLADPELPTPERRDALRFVLHLAGDLHQPLHVARGADRGGNDIQVTFFGRPTDLHDLWDDLLLERRAGSFWRGGDWSRIARRLARTTSRAEARRWVVGGPRDWGAGTLDAALRHAYPGAPDGARLGRRYYRRNVGVAEEQLRRAGVRLAALLEEALAPREETRR